MKRDTGGVLFVVFAGALLLVGIVFLRRSSAPVSSPPAPSLGVPPGSPAPPASLNPIDEMEQRLLDLTNEQRTRGALRPLDREAGLSAAARSHSEDMLRRRFFDHVNPDQQTPADRVARISGLPAGAIGENIWMWSGSILPPRYRLVEQAVAEWMANPAHRANILRPGYTRLGVGAAANHSDVRLTEVFME